MLTVFASIFFVSFECWILSSSSISLFPPSLVISIKELANTRRLATATTTTTMRRHNLGSRSANQPFVEYTRDFNDVQATQPLNLDSSQQGTIGILNIWISRKEYEFGEMSYSGNAPIVCSQVPRRVRKKAT